MKATQAGVEGEIKRAAEKKARQDKAEENARVQKICEDHQRMQQDYGDKEPDEPEQKIKL